jgi:hypothetical protein
MRTHRVPTTRLTAVSLTKALVFPLVLALHTSAWVSGQGPIVTDRPDQTESAVVVPAGLVQIEAGLVYEAADEAGVETKTVQLPSTLVRIGLADGLELRAGWDGVVNEQVDLGGGDVDESGTGDTSLGAKLELLEARGRRPQMALIVSSTLPTGDDALGSERLDPAFRLSTAHELTERVGLGWNLGAAWASEPDATGELDTLSVLEYTAALGLGLTERTGAFVELFGAVPLSAAGGPEHLFDGGFTHLARDNVQLDVSAGVGLSDDAIDWLAGAGLSIRLPR